VIYCVEVIFKWTALTRKVYLSSKWNLFDLVIAIISFIEAIASALIQDMILAQTSAQGNDKAATAIQLIKSVKVNTFQN
jgi:hypothetical protein